MSVAAVMLVKDEADVIGATLDHLLGEVDAILVADNGSTDGTLEIIEEKADRYPRITVTIDSDPGYWQSRKTTALAMRALDDGHQWVIPCDADEVWYADGRPIREHLGSLAPDVQIVEAELHHHIPTAEDDEDEPNPFIRIGWRKRWRSELGKVACRLRPDLVIEAGNHVARTTGTALAVKGGLHVRHFSWRSEEQYLRKITNGARAYAATDIPFDTGTHWRHHGLPEDEGFEERVRENFRGGFYSLRPREDDSMIYDPVPLRPRPRARAETAERETRVWDPGRKRKERPAEAGL